MIHDGVNGWDLVKAEANVRLEQLGMTQQAESSREQGLVVINHSRIPQ